jgi:glutamate-5-semialdehyde dehydrogenase
MLDQLKAGTTVLSAAGKTFQVSESLAGEFKPGDSIIANDTSGLLLIPAQERLLAASAVDRAVTAFEQMEAATDAQLVSFFHHCADLLADDKVWQKIEAVNQIDLHNAKARGRSTTRLAVSEQMRSQMIDGLHGWADMPSRRDAVLETVNHSNFRVELVGAALGVVAFIFEGRPNVLADACGVLRSGNTAVFRIGSDALATANEIMALSVRPALRQAGLPEGAMTLINSATHSAGWALFLDPRLSLAVARGSGPAVDLLGSLAQSSGVPVSLHGTGGAWMVASAKASAIALQEAVAQSLDRKVCNTLNTCCIERSQADSLIPAFLAGLQAAAQGRGTEFKLHVAMASQDQVPAELFTKQVNITRAAGTQLEAQAELVAAQNYGEEWEWEDCPEVTLIVVDSIAAAARLFNEHSPRLVASLISEAEAEHAEFWTQIHSPFVGDNLTRWVDGQYALAKPELGLSNWANGRLFGRGAILTGDSVYTVRTRYVTN